MTLARPLVVSQTEWDAALAAMSEREETISTSMHPTSWLSCAWLATVTADVAASLGGLGGDVVAAALVDAVRPVVPGVTRQLARTSDRWRRTGAADQHGAPTLPIRPRRTSAEIAH